MPSFMELFLEEEQNMFERFKLTQRAFILTAVIGVMALQVQAEVTGWLDWRGPHQTGVSDETGLPDKIELNGENHLWTKDLSGRGQPVIVSHNGKERVYAIGYRGEGTELREYLVCLDPVTGETIWEQGFSDFLSDNV